MTQTRREIASSLATAILVGALAGSRAFAGGRPEAMAVWARGLVALNQALAAGEIDAAMWQDKIEALNASVPVADLVSYLDIDALTANFKYASNLAETVDPKLPDEILNSAGLRSRKWFVRVFAMRKGGAIIPHVHNGMASAHLVIDGAFHVRTANRIEDHADAVVLRPTRDTHYGKGEVLSMSETRDNMHWLVATQNRSMTFDAGVVDTAPLRTDLKLPANEYHMIFVDADRRPERGGDIVAPVMSFAACAKKYADWTG